MLKKLRNKKTSKRILIVLAVIIIPAFAFWGFSSMLGGPEGSGYVGKISGRSVSILDYKDAVDAVKNMALIQYGDNFSQMKDSLNLDSEAWDRLVILAEAKKRKIAVSDKELTSFIRDYPFFQNNGRFDEGLYAELLQFVFQTPARNFEEQTRQNLIISKLYKEVTKDVKLEDRQIMEEYRKINEGLSLTYIAAIPAEFAKDIEPKENELKEYYKGNPLQFKQPLSYNLDYVALAKENISSEKLKEIFISFKKEGNFSKTAQALGLEAKETGLFAENDPIPGIGWAPQILGLIAKSKAGEYLNPVEMDKYYYILRVREKKDPYIPEFSAIEGKVKAAYIADRSKQAAKEKISACLNRLKSQSQQDPRSVNLEQSARESALKYGNTDVFKYGSYIEGIGASDIFWTAAEGLKNNDFSGIIETPGGFYIIKVKSRSPIDEKKFENEKAKFSEMLLLQKKQENFYKFLEELKTKSQKF